MLSQGKECRGHHECLIAEEELNLLANSDDIPLLQSKYPQDPSRVSGRIDFDEWVWHKLQISIVLQEELDDYMVKWNDPSVAISGYGWCDRDHVMAYENNKKSNYFGTDYHISYKGGRLVG